MKQFQFIVLFHIETSHMIYSADQMTGYYTECNTRLKWTENSPTLEMMQKSLDIYKDRNFSKISANNSIFKILIFFPLAVIKYEEGNQK